MPALGGGATDARTQQIVLPLIRSRVPSLTEGDRRVAEFILSEPAATVESSVTDVARRASVSHSTVIRFCQGLDLRGFADLKLALARELALPLSWANTPVDPEDDASEVLEKVLTSTIAALREVPVTLDANVLAKAADALAAAGKVLLFGVSASGRVAAEGALRLVHMGVEAQATEETFLANSIASLLTERDVCIAVSKSGETRDTVSVADVARAAGASVIAISNFQASPLADKAHYVLVGGARDGSFRMGRSMTTIIHLAVLEALIVYVASRSPERTNELINRTASASTGLQY